MTSLSSQFDDAHDVSLIGRYKKRPVPKSACGRFFVGCFFPCTSCFYEDTTTETTKGGALLAIFACVLLLGALFFWGVEGSAECRANNVPFPSGLVKWTYGASVYFWLVTSTTIGYGDYSPATPGGKVFCIFWGILSIAVVAAATGYFTASLVQRFEESEHMLIKFLARRGLSKRVVAVLVEYRNWVFVLCFYLFLLVSGAFLFGWAEPFPEPRFLNGLYFTFITLATVGYGDLLVKHSGTRLWMCFFAILGVGMFGFMVATLSNHVTKAALLSKKRTADTSEAESTFRAAMAALDKVRDSHAQLSPPEREALRAHATEVFGF